MKKITKGDVGMVLPVVGVGLITYSFIGAKSFKSGTIFGVAGLAVIVTGFVLMATDNTPE